MDTPKGFLPQTQNFQHFVWKSDYRQYDYIHATRQLKPHHIPWTAVQFQQMTSKLTIHLTRIFYQAYYIFFIPRKQLYVC